MTNRHAKICFCRSLRLIIAVAILWGPHTNAQDEPKSVLPKDEKGWTANLVSGLFPGTKTEKVKARIEDGQLVCRSDASAILEIPLKSITRVSRDTTKDYPAAQFLVGAALQPSIQRPRFGSRRYREEAAARATLGALAFSALLFPRHKDEIYLSWTDDDGEHGAGFLMGRKEGHAMLERLKQQTGIEARDLEKERKAYEKRMRESRHRRSP